jgi:hypothetical protein
MGIGTRAVQHFSVPTKRAAAFAGAGMKRIGSRLTVVSMLLLSASVAATGGATGFNRLNMVTREGGAQPKEYLAKYAADRVRTVSMAWLGSTMGCAECHDHKFDPFTSKDFYQMEAFFADIKQWGVYADYGYTPNPELKGIGNDDPFPPELEVTSPYLERRLKKIEAKVETLYAQAAVKLEADTSLRQQFEAWRQSSLTFLKQHPSGWASPMPDLTIKTEKPDSSAQTN